ncbi:MAG: EAL domain-containing protein [Candidatus Eremiobacteraeota bacterium]|nr:EAL domain-containing protein [Candidatus Eremiobacteraeota bacterium]
MTTYLWLGSHFAFPAAILVAAIAQSLRGNERVSGRHARLIVAALIAAALFAGADAPLLLLARRARLPSLSDGAWYSAGATAMILPAVAMIHIWALAALALARKDRTSKMRWISIALLASLFDTMIGILCAEYSYGWYGGKLFAMLASSVVFAAFVSQITSLQTKLARANAELRELNAQERRDAEKRLRYLAYHDEMTGLNNRPHWQEHLTSFAASQTGLDAGFAVLFVDLDRFKEVNDALGHAVGDQVLRMAAQRLKATIRECDVIGRLGGDEFAVTMTAVAERGDANALAMRLRDELRRPFQLHDRTFHLSASIGIAHFPEHGTSVETLLKHADLALYQAKHDGGDCEREYDDMMGQLRHQRRTMQQSLRRALEEREFELYYQPILDARSGRLASAEALIRWNDPGNGVVGPAAFLPLAEDSGLMEPVGRWTLEAVASQLIAWHGTAPTPCVAVNISVRQLQDPAFFEHLIATIEGRGIHPSQVELEVTESVALSDAGAATELLGRCHDLGFRIALDDFGTHYSSLTYLQRLPIDKIKIDKSFVEGLPFNDQDAAIVRSIIVLGHELHRTIVAEGVETHEQFDWLVKAGCDYIQGFLVARPMPAHALTAWQPKWHGFYFPQGTLVAGA